MWLTRIEREMTHKLTITATATFPISLFLSLCSCLFHRIFGAIRTVLGSSFLSLPSPGPALTHVSSNQNWDLRYFKRKSGFLIKRQKEKLSFLFQHDCIQSDPFIIFFSLFLLGYAIMNLVWSFSFFFFSLFYSLRYVFQVDAHQCILNSVSTIWAIFNTIASICNKSFWKLQVKVLNHMKKFIRIKKT